MYKVSNRQPTRVLTRPLTGIIPSSEAKQTPTIKMQPLPPGGIQIINMDASIPPESGHTPDGTVGVLGILGARNSATGIGYVGIMKEKYPNGRFGVSLQGLELDSEGGLTETENTHRVLFPPDGELVLGREAQRSADPHFVSAAALWGGDRTFGGDTSRIHAKIRFADSAVYVKDESKYGTWISANLVDPNGVSGDSQGTASSEAVTEQLDSLLPREVGRGAIYHASQVGGGGK
ncbi:MAG TPA: FHA domain-containing protein [Candidatus Saccharimonadales bacterium]|jgi:hypothetical protein